MVRDLNDNFIEKYEAHQDKTEGYDLDLAGIEIAPPWDKSGKKEDSRRNSTIVLSQRIVRRSYIELMSIDAVLCM